MNLRGANAAWITLLALSGCAGLVHPADVHVAWAAERWPNVTLADLEQGREMYVEHCAGCHVLRRPARLTPDAWADQLDKMELEQDVDLTSDERQLILQYLEAASAIPVVPKEG